MRLILTLALSFALTASLDIGASAASEFTSRSDFSWGINGHNQTYKSYPIRYLDQQIKLAAELGVQIYRFNYNPTNGNDYKYLDSVVSLVQRYGMDMMLVLDDFGPSAEVLHNRCQTIANRYNGKNGHGTIAYIQVYNEVDVWAMTTTESRFTDISSRREGDGTVASHYSQMALAEVLPKFREGVAGVKAGNPNCKAVINISYMHTYLFDYLKENGVQWDLTGIDWYENMGAFSTILNRLASRYSQDIMICETNIWPFTASQESEYENDTTFLPNAMREIYNNYPRVKGMIFYELLDEPQYQMTAGRYEGESHFGFIKVNSSDFSIGAKKPIYHRVQQMLGGGPKEPAPSTTVSSRPNSTSSAVASNPGSVSSRPSASSAGPNSPGTIASQPNAGSSEPNAVSSGSSTTASSSQDISNISDLASSSNQTNGEKPGASRNRHIWTIVIICITTALIIAIAAFLILKIKYGKFAGFLDNIAKKK